MTRTFLVVGSFANACLTVSVQLIALAFLSPAEFGMFSFVYLFYGLGLSISHSLVIDVWVRSAPGTIGWPTYGAALAWLAIALSALAFIATVALAQSPLVAAAIAIGIGAGIYRNGSRFHSARLFSWRHVIVSDVAGCAVLVAAFFALAPSVGSFHALLFAWALSQCTATLLSRQVAPQAPTALVRWLSQHWAAIRQLWLDSSLLDISVIGTPLVVSGFMSLADFGVYRAVSSAALPVRLLLAPLRPNISNLPLRSVRGRSTTLAVLGAGLAMGTLVAALLLAIRAWEILPDSILPHLADYAAAAAVFTCASLISSVYYVAARSQLSFDQVRSGRYFETVVMVAGPLAGLAGAGLTGAIWGFAIGSVLVAANWFRIVRWAR